MIHRIFLPLIFMFSVQSGYAQNVKARNDTASIFPKGTRGIATNFTGVVWSYPLLADDTVYNCVMGNVTFEPGARSNWHYHQSGQILIITDGVGYYQEKGKPIELMRKGDVIKCPPNVTHWHGASPDSACTHIAIVTNTQKGVVKWLQPVSDQEYYKQK